jgi:hypothetical protein
LPSAQELNRDYALELRNECITPTAKAVQGKRAKNQQLRFEKRISATVPRIARWPRRPWIWWAGFAWPAALKPEFALTVQLLISGSMDFSAHEIAGRTAMKRKCRRKSGKSVSTLLFLSVIPVDLVYLAHAMKKNFAEEENRRIDALFEQCLRPAYRMLFLQVVLHYQILV